MYTQLMYMWMYPNWVVCCDICSGIYIGVPSLIVDNWFYISALILLWGWAEMKSSAGTLTTKRVDRVVAYKSARMYATDYTVRTFFQEWKGRMERACIMNHSYIPYALLGY